MPMLPTNRLRKIDPNNLFFAADLHFGHRGILTFGSRPFTSVKEMDATIIERWNQTVPENGVVFLLGDVSFSGDVSQILALNGKIHLVRGNHDKNDFVNKLLRHHIIAEVYDLLHITVENDEEPAQDIVLCHYPLYEWNKCHYGSWHLHGHTHGNLPVSLYRRKDVGIDCNDLKPISYWALKEKMKYRKIKNHHTEIEVI
jgi:calcineurin-like phosphoesterase family protein